MGWEVKCQTMDVAAIQAFSTVGCSVEYIVFCTQIVRYVPQW